MERFFKRYFWTVNVVVALALGAFAARTVSALVAARLVAPPSTAPASARHPIAAPVAASTVDARALASLFGVTLPDPSAEAAEAKLPPPGTEVPTTLNATLVATIEAKPDEYSLAVITDNSTRDTGVYGIGDTVMDTAKLIKVERRRVLVDNNGRTEVLAMDATQTGGTPGIPTIGPRFHEVSAFDRQNPSGSSGGIRQTNANHYLVSQQTIENTLSNLNNIATQARIVPAFRNGVAEGFKLFSIRPGSIYARIGIQNGDVIQRINGFEINSPDKALEVYQKLRDARRIEVQLDRRGQTITKVYNIQ